MLAFLLSLLLSVTTFFYKKSKILFVIIFVFMWVLFGFNYSNADFPMYQNLYNIPLSEFTFLKSEGGYSLLMYLGKLLGLSFQQFFIVLSGIILLLVFRFFYIFSSFPALAALCFFCFLFPLQYVILRNFLAFAIVLQGFILVLKNNQHSAIKFIFLVILAATIHISSLFYLVFLFAFKERELKIKTIAIWVLGLLGLVIISHQFLFKLLTSYNLEKAEFYTTKIPLFLFYSLLQIINLIVVYNILKTDENVEGKNTKKTNIVILNCNIIMLLLIIVYYEMGVFVRMLLNMSIINVVFLTNNLLIGKPKMTLKVLYFSYLLLLFFIFIYIVKENTILSLFNKNLLFNTINFTNGK